MVEDPWKLVTRVLATIGFIIACYALIAGIAVPVGFFVILAGLFFGPDIYTHWGPGER